MPTLSNDKLLASLAALSQLIGRPTSQAALAAGLPLTDHHITPELFPRAASRVGLKAKLEKFSLDNQHFHFPVPIILILQNEDACILTDITGHGTAKIIHPPEYTPEEILLSELQKVYSGEAFILELDFHFSSRSDHIAKEREQKNWFWNAVIKLWSSYGEMFIASFLINIFAIAVPLFTMNVYDRVIPNHSFTTLWVLASGIFIVFIFDILMRVLRGYFIDEAGKTVDLEVSALILERVMGIRMLEFPPSVGAFANTLQSFDAVREFITSTTVTILVDLPFAILFIIIIGIIGGSLIWIPLIMFPLVIIFGLILQRPLIKYTTMSQRFSSEKQAILYEILNNMESVKIDGAENIMQRRWEQIINLSAQVGVKMRFAVNISIFFSVFIQQLSTVLVVIAGVYLISTNQLTTGGLIACTILASRALAPVAQVAGLLTRYHQSVTALDSLNNVMKLPPERSLSQASLHISRLRGEIEFRDVTFQYPSRAEAVLQKVFLKISPGEHVGIIGRVGSGKTTLAKLMLGLLQPTSGTIFFDGIDQAQLDLTELRQNIGYVPQDVTLFFGSLRDNITFGAPHVEDNQIIRAIQISGIDELLKPALGSYEAEITEGGKNLSGGQRRIIAIARAILLDPPILIFDEPTHSMDNQTEKAIKAKLEPYLKDKTFILMTHRTPVLSLVDRLIIIDGGKIIMDGPKDAVLHALSEGKIKVPKG